MDDDKDVFQEWMDGIRRLAIVALACTLGMIASYLVWRAWL